MVRISTLIKRNASNPLEIVLLCVEHLKYFPNFSSNFSNKYKHGIYLINFLFPIQVHIFDQFPEEGEVSLRKLRFRLEFSRHIQGQVIIGTVRNFFLPFLNSSIFEFYF